MYNLNFNYDALSDVIIIEGIRYSGQLFRSFADNDALPLNTLFKLINRHHTTISIQDVKASIQNGGKFLYESYCEFSDNKSLISGDELPNFYSLPEKIQEAWNHVYESIINKITESE